MTRQDLQQLATVEDLNKIEFRLFKELKKISDSLNQIHNGKKAQALGEIPFLSPKQFADRVGVSKSTATSWCAKGIVRATQEEGKRCLWQIPASEVQRILDKANSIEPEIR